MDRRSKESKLILIGVQARTNSTRLPNKANIDICGKTLTEHVMDSCIEAAGFLNRNFNKLQAIVKVALLVPGNDPIAERYSRQYRVQSFPEFPEADVLSRYVAAARETKADYIVRITGDCVLTAPYLVSRCVKSALFERYDYVSNCLLRTFREGMDTEVVSKRLLEWLDSNSLPHEREHVTQALTNRDRVPRDFSFCHILNDVDDSHIKTSIDTKEDVDRVIAEKQSCATKRGQAMAWGDSVA